MTTAIITTRPADPVREALGQAPIGAHGIVEAAFAWRQLRPSRGVPRSTALRHLPIALTPYEEVAARLARLLTGVAWAVVTDDVPLRVEVPRATYDRVVRTFTAVWRQTVSELATARPDPTLCAALWRMALLIDGVPSRACGRHRVHCPLPSTGDVLARAARALGATAEAVHDPSGGVLIASSADVRLLLTRAGATPRPLVTA